MNNKSILFFLIILTFSSCKRHLGRYCSDANLSGWCYELEKGHQFKYEESSCLHSAVGDGEYEIRGDTLRFKFNPNETLNESSKLVRVNHDALNVGVELTVVDAKTEAPIVGYSAVLLQDHQFVKGGHGNFSGKVSLKTPFEHQPITSLFKVEISMIGYQPRVLYLLEPGIFKAHLELDEGWNSKISDVIHEYQLIKLSKDSLIYGDFEDEALRKILTKKRHAKRNNRTN